VSLHLDLLRRITGEMAATPKLPILLESIINALLAHSGASAARVHLYLTDEECETCRALGLVGQTKPIGARCLHLAAAAGSLVGVLGRHPVVSLDTPGHLTRVASTRRPLLTNDLPGQTPAGDVEVQLHIMRTLGIKAAGALPLEFRGELLGVMGLLSSSPLEPITFELLQIFADQAAMAIKNAHLYDELERYRQRLEMENAYLRDEIRSENEFGEIIGGSPALQAVLRKVTQVAAVDSTVLLTGETGTGKELVARAIHTRSPRRERAMIKMNCGAIPTGVVESELFGHEKGAFTGALQRRIGRFELADRSTLFMDEVGELPPDTQVKLLRVLQEQEFERVGSMRAIKVDVRLVVATNRDLETEVAQGRFRSDLFYRMNVFPIHIPPLRERPSDIPILVRHFLALFQRKLGKPLRGFTAQGLQRLQSYEWPGNIRELQNVIEHACVLTKGPIVDLGDAIRLSDHEATLPSSLEPIVTLEEHERRHIQRALATAEGKVHGPGGAAELLAINASTLRSRMEKLGIAKGN
jgi:formate hydrogenlyase transcriptional activator